MKPDTSNAASVKDPQCRISVSLYLCLYGETRPRPHNIVEDFKLLKNLTK